jgi:hypothetical protein
MSRSSITVLRVTKMKAEVPHEQHEKNYPTCNLVNKPESNGRCSVFSYNSARFEGRLNRGTGVIKR